MVDFIKKIFGENWKTTLSGIAVLVAVAFKCIAGGGQFFDCIQEGWSLAFIAGGAGLLAAKDGSAK